ncbi:MAG: tetratricopeptide repeat protein [Microcoleaceae cyanobacterium MO_207.B10]|nr:tetratricopeptide repeat protein [Microcoleaceae cyanobacterium MO_207.B10]
MVSITKDELDTINYNFKLAQELTRKLEFDGAISSYLSIVKLDENHAASWHHLAKLYENLGDWQAAVNCYEKVIAIKPEYGVVYVQLALALKKQGKIQEAINAYQVAIRLNPQQDFTVYLQLADIYRQEAKLDEAINNFQKAIQINPHLSPFVYVRLGDLLSQKGEEKQAINYWQIASKKIAMTSHPNFVEKYWEKGELRGPSFLIISPGRCGSTSLYNYLVQHPQVIPAIRKEIGFLTHQPYNKNHQVYNAQFPPLPNDKNFITGEAGTGYWMNYPGERIKSYFPHIKLIIMMRNPVERAISHYKSAVKVGREKRSLEEVIDAHLGALSDLDRVFINNKVQNWKQVRPGYFLRGLYIYFIGKWLSLFPRENLLFLKSEDLFDSPDSTMLKIINFLNLPEYSLLKYENYNASSQNYLSQISGTQRQLISDFFRPHNQKLEEYLGISFNWK